MTNHRYTELIQPLDRFLRRLPPRSKRVLALAEGSLLLLLITSVCFYTR